MIPLTRECDTPGYADEELARLDNFQPCLADRNSHFSQEVVSISSQVMHHKWKPSQTASTALSRDKMENWTRSNVKFQHISGLQKCELPTFFLVKWAALLDIIIISGECEQRWIHCGGSFPHIIKKKPSGWTVILSDVNHTYVCHCNAPIW